MTKKIDDLLKGEAGLPDPTREGIIPVSQWGVTALLSLSSGSPFAYQ